MADIFDRFGWPYAAKAVVEHEFDTDHLNIWLTFKYAMDILKKPANSKWIISIDGENFIPDSSAWQDLFTLLLVVNEIEAPPARVLVTYDGPDQNLLISWDKQWEPWGPILSINIGG